MVTERDIAIELIGETVDRCADELGKCRTDHDKVLWLRRSIAKHDIAIGYWPDVDNGGIGYFVVKGEDAVFSLWYVAQAAGDGWRVNHGFTTFTFPCLDLEDAKKVQRAFTEGDGKVKLAKLFDALPPEERDGLKVQYGLVSVQ